MTSQSPRIYLYKITFEEVPYYYYGVHKEKRFNEEYWGSPITNKWCWELYTPKKQILQFFDYTDKGWMEANLVEDRLIRPFFNTDKWCLNESCGGKISLEVLRETGKITNQLGVGIHGLTKKELSENGKKGSKRAKELKVGIFALTREQLSENGRKGNKEGKRESGKNAAAKNKKNGVGIFALTREQLSETTKKLNSQKWMCLETGYITNSGALSMYQRARGIDTSKRKRIS